MILKDTLLSLFVALHLLNLAKCEVDFPVGVNMKLGRGDLKLRPQRLDFCALQIVIIIPPQRYHRQALLWYNQFVFVRMRMPIRVKQIKLAGQRFKSRDQLGF